MNDTVLITVMTANNEVGTENVPAIVGFGKICKISLKTGRESYDNVKKLRDSFEGRILSEIKGAALNGHSAKRLPNTLNVSFGDIEGDSVVLSLDMEGIAVSTGSACASGSAERIACIEKHGRNTFCGKVLGKIFIWSLQCG